jgi:hypothetical protein
MSGTDPLISHTIERLIGRGVEAPRTPCDEIQRITEEHPPVSFDDAPTCSTGDAEQVHPM